MTAIARDTYVRHKVYVHRGTGKVTRVGPTILRSQTPKLLVAFERGGPLWCWPDDLTVLSMTPPKSARPTLRAIEPTAPSAA